MPWHPSLNSLRDVLADLYPDALDMRRVAASASLPLGRVALQGKPVNDWQAILAEAIKQACLQALVEVVVAEYGKNPALRAAISAQQRAASPTGPSTLSLGRRAALELVRVPAGEFVMGSADADAGASAAERPQHSLWLPEYLIGKYPVTVAQYRAFVQATGYRIRYRDAAQGPDDYPVVVVSWPEALAFCDWAGHVNGCRVRLPSEAEWEKAARGTDGRLHPWGNLWDPRRCNSDQGRVGHPTPVGRYSPLGDSPYGCADMVGNVWEWTRSLWGKDRWTPQFGYPYDPQDGRESAKAEQGMMRAVRGGSFRNARLVRCAVRYRYGPEAALDCVGFRVAAVPTSP